MGPVVVFVVVPMGVDRSEVRVFFPLGLEYDSRQRVPTEFRRSWPGIEILPDHMPMWVVNDFDRRALFEAIATRGPLPPGAPPRVPQTPLPWRAQPGDDRHPSGSQSGGQVELSGKDAEIVRLWTEGRTAAQIATHLERETKTIENRITALRRKYGTDLVPHHRVKADSGEGPVP